MTTAAAVEPRVLAPGEEIAPGYEVVELLSRGQALDVYEVYSQARLCSCVAKTLRPDRVRVDRVRKRLLQEGRLLQTLTHPHLPRALDTIAGPVPIVVLETLTGDTLEELVLMRSRRLPALDLAYLGLQLSSAVHYLHTAGYLHLDIRPANVLAEAGTATLIDLSIARPPGPVRRGLGTREYMSPEQARGGQVTAASDVWGLGVTLFEAATGTVPFPVTGQGQLTRQLAPLARERPRLHRGLADLVSACCAPDPAARPDVRTVHATLLDVVDELTAERPS